jgi:hypothetical protein
MPGGGCVGRAGLDSLDPRRQPPAVPESLVLGCGGIAPIDAQAQPCSSAAKSRLCKVESSRYLELRL